MTTGRAPPVRCAIYTRKSSAEGLDAEFSSLHAQRSYCASYIGSQGGEGWTELPDRYDDGGFSGGSLRRPALTRLREHIEAGLVDVVVVYKIDRLSRSLRDFVNLVAEFEQRGVTFVAVTQSFNTATPMGRLTLNVLLSFAQFEREVTGERLRDWFAGARARGLWVPRRPYGYRKDANRLVVEPAEAAIVRRVFARYIKLGSCRLVANELFGDGVLNMNGKPFGPAGIRHMITHRVYRGEIVHRRKGQPGPHEPIVSEATWQRARKVMARSTKWRRPLASKPPDIMLVGLLFDRRGGRMHHTFTRSKGFLYRYYVAGAEKYRYGPGSSPYARFRAAELEAAVLGLVDRIVGTPDPSWRNEHEAIWFVRRMIERIDIGDGDMAVTLRTGAVLRAECAGRLGIR